MTVQYLEEHTMNSRGELLFTCRWLPFSSPKALVFLCHGYGMECSVYMRECGIKLAVAGYAVFGIDYVGHGKSTGERCYVDKFENIVDDCSEFFKYICAQKEYREKKRFIYGESLGGAVAIMLHKEDPSFWNGAILVAPMCKISDNMKPNPLVVNILTKMEQIIPKWKVVPVNDVISSSFKDPIKREGIRNNKLVYQGKPRLRTALELLKMSTSIEERLNEVKFPFFVLQGEEDKVTDPEVSKALYEKAESKDKTLKLYPGMWHGLIAGEPDENVKIVFTDILAWLDKRCKVASLEKNRYAFKERFVDMYLKDVSINRKGITGH